MGLTLGLLSLSAPLSAQTSPPQKAGFTLVEAAEVDVVHHLSGRAVAQNRTLLRPRVSGVLMEVLYQPGTLVEVGTPLFRIDPLTYEIAVTTAEASLERAKADLANAQATYERVKQLQGGASSLTALESAETTLQKAQASLIEAEANLRLARAQLDWTTLRAPISGIVDLPNVAIGDLVTANQSDPLTEIVQTDPIYIDLTEPYALRQRFEAAVAAGEVTPLETPLLVLRDHEGRVYEMPARQVSSSASVSITAGTRVLRFELANPDGRIAPGMFLRAELILGTTEALLVPQRATQRERDGSLTAWIAEDGKAVKRLLSERGNEGNNWVVIQGLEVGDQLLLDGTNSLREGRELELIPAYIDAQGVVRDGADPAAQQSGQE